MPERIRNLYIGDGYFELTKDVIDMLPYNIKYIKVITLYGRQPDQKLLSLLDRHQSAADSKNIR